MLEDRSATETADRHSSAANSSRLVAAGQAFGVLILAMAMNAIAADAAAQGGKGVDGMSEDNYLRFQSAAHAMIKSFRTTQGGDKWGVAATTARLLSALNTYRNERYRLYKDDARLAADQLASKINMWQRGQPPSPYQMRAIECEGQYRSCKGKADELLCGVVLVICLGEPLTSKNLGLWSEDPQGALGLAYDRGIRSGRSQTLLE